MLLGELQLEWYKLLFLAELVIAEGLFTHTLKRRKFFSLRLLGGSLFIFLFTFFYPILTTNAVYTSLMFLMIFSCSVGALKLCFKESFKTLVFCAIAAYSVQHVAYQCYNLVVNIAGLAGSEGLGIYDDRVHENPNVMIMMIYFIVYYFVYWLMYLLFARQITKNKNVVIKNAALLVLIALALFVAVFANAIVTYRSYDNYDLTYVVMSGISSIVCMTLVLTLQFKLLLQKNLEEELDKAYHLLRQEKKQYDVAKENIDLINIKCHDLKHQIRVIGRSGKVGEEQLREIEKVINIYDSAVKTGNDVLDVILTEKSLACESRNISLTCVVDGKKLDFIDEIDLYTLFGNAFDNAIEAVGELPPEKRVISLTTKGSGTLFSVVLRNFCREGIKFDGGLPLTSKSDKLYHGFGMRSIKRITEKYGGDLSVIVENGIFNLNLLFDLTESKAASRDANTDVSVIG